MQSDKPSKIELPRNPATYRRHRREVLWQIIVPTAVFGTILLAFAAFTAFGLSAGSASQLADVSLSYLIWLTMIFMLIPLALIAASAYGITRLLQILPYNMLRVQIFFLKVQVYVFKTTDQLVKPVMGIRGMDARRRAFGRSLRGRSG